MPLLNEQDLENYCVSYFNQIGYQTAYGLDILTESINPLRQNIREPFLPTIVKNKLEQLNPNTPTRYVGIDELPQFLSYYSVNDKGLDKSDISYLKCLYNNVLEGKRLPVGLKALEKKTKLPQDEIEDNIEPKLIQLNYISFSDKGRFLTEEGLNYVASLM